MFTSKDLPEGWEYEPKGYEHREVDVLHLRGTRFRMSIDGRSGKWYVDYTVFSVGEFDTWKVASELFVTESEAMHWAIVAIRTGLYKDWM